MEEYAQMLLAELPACQKLAALGYPDPLARLCEMYYQAIHRQDDPHRSAPLAAG